MKHRRMLVLSCLFLLLSGPASLAAAMTDLEAIDMVRMEFNAAFKESDARALAKLIDRDAVWIPPGHKPILGRKAIRAYYEQRFSSAASHIRLHPGAIELMGNWAILHSSFSRIDSADSDSGSLVFSGNYMWVLRKQTDNTWKIARDIWSEVSRDEALDQALAKAELLADLEPSERELLKPAAALRRIQAGEHIARHGHYPGKIFIVLDGKAQVEHQGRLITTLSGEIIVGETEFLDKKPMFADVIVQEDTQVIELDNDRLSEILHKHPGLGYAVMREIALIEARRLRSTTVECFPAR